MVQKDDIMVQKDDINKKTYNAIADIYVEEESLDQ